MSDSSFAFKGFILACMVVFMVVAITERRNSDRAKAIYAEDACAKVTDRAWPTLASVTGPELSAQGYCEQQLQDWQSSVISPPVLPCTIDGIAAFCSKYDAVTRVFEPSALGEISAIVEDDHQDPSPTIIMLGSVSAGARDE